MITIDEFLKDGAFAYIAGNDRLVMVKCHKRGDMYALTLHDFKTLKHLFALLCDRETVISFYNINYPRKTEAVTD